MTNENPLGKQIDKEKNKQHAAAHTEAIKAGFELSALHADFKNSQEMLGSTVFNYCFQLFPQIFIN